MTRHPRALRRSGVVGILCLALVPGPVDASVGQPAAEGSVATLLSPAHGTAFAFGQPGHLLTSRHAIGQASLVRLVTPGGATEDATVVTTNDASIVQLRGSLVLPALRGASEPKPGSAIQVISGPLNGARVGSGKVASGAGSTDISSAPAFDGAPVLDRRGDVVGVATVVGTRVAFIRTAHLHAAAPRATASGSDSTALIPVLAIVFVFGLGVGIARFAVRTRVGQRLNATGSAAPRHAPAPPPVPPTSSRAERERSEADTAVHVVLRPGEPDGGQLPEVRLRPRSSASTRLHGTAED